MVGEYIGILPTYEIPTTCIYKEFSHSEKNAGKVVNYWHVWIKEAGFIKPTFKEDELQKDKVMAFDKMFNNQKTKKYK